MKAEATLYSFWFVSFWNEVELLKQSEGSRNEYPWVSSSSLCGAFGRVAVADGDRHLGHPQAVLLGQELHLRFNAEIVRFKLDQLDGPGGEGPKPALRIRHVDARGYAGGQVDQLVAEASALGGVRG